MFIQFQLKNGESQIVNSSKIISIVRAQQRHEGHGCRPEESLRIHGNLLLEEADGQRAFDRATGVFTGGTFFGEDHPFVVAINALPVIEGKEQERCQEKAVDKDSLMGALEKIKEAIK